MAGNVIEINGSEFKDKVSAAGVPVVVDFWAPWCGPCKAIAPILEELAAEMGDAVSIYKVNVDDNQDLARELGIRAIPTLMLYREGKLADQMVGVTSKEDLKRRLS